MDGGQEPWWEGWEQDTELFLKNVVGGALAPHL